MKRRSQFTEYTYTRCTIYEYNATYFVMQESQQGQELIEVHGPAQRASTLSGLIDSFPLDVSAELLGQAIKKALDSYDTIPPPYGDFDFSARNKFIKKCMKARGMAEWERNQRVVDVEFSITKDEYTIRPFDNNRINPWIGPQDMPSYTLSNQIDEKTLGEAVLKAFAIATYHPMRTK